ncbi:MAG: hypothetical protein ACPF9D_00475, partial [Owenweeksia sp.]
KSDTSQTEQDEAPEVEKRTVKPGAVTPSKSEEPNFWDRVVFGGNASASFGNYTLIYVSPSVGYKVRENLIAGGGFIYQYAKINQVYDPNRGAFVEVEGYENQVYGPKVFVNYFPVDFLYVGTQFEYLNHDVAYYNPATNPATYYLQNQWTPVLFLEGGYAQPLGNKGYVQLGLRFNVLHDFDSPYGSSWFPVIGFFF